MKFFEYILIQPYTQDPEIYVSPKFIQKLEFPYFHRDNAMT